MHRGRPLPRPHLSPLWYANYPRLVQSHYFLVLQGGDALRALLFGAEGAERESVLGALIERSHSGELATLLEERAKHRESMAATAHSASEVDRLNLAAAHDWERLSQHVSSRNSAFLRATSAAANLFAHLKQ